MEIFHYKYQDKKKTDFYKWMQHLYDDQDREKETNSPPCTTLEKAQPLGVRNIRR